MAHQRQLIREAAKSQLVAAATAAGSRVFETRMIAWREVELPAIAVYTLEETIDPASKNSAPMELIRDLKLEIVGTLRPGDDTDDALDALALQIEKAIHADPTLGDTCSFASLESTDMGVLVDGAKQMGQISLVFSVRYYTYAPDSDDITLADLVTVDVKTNLGNAQDPRDEAEDTLTGLDE